MARQAVNNINPSFQTPAGIMLNDYRDVAASDQDFVLCRPDSYFTPFKT
jgi:hypothetical protein